MMTDPGWHPDPGGQYEYRWWDGELWSESVAHGGQTFVHPLPSAPPGIAPGQSFTQQHSSQPTTAQPVANQPIANQQAQPGVDPNQPSIFNVNALIMIQREKRAFTFHDEEEKLLGHMVADPRSSKRQPIYNVTDASGQPLARALTQVRSLVIDTPAGRIGEVRQSNLLTVQKLKFEYRVNGQVIGTLEGKSWSDEQNLNIVDTAGQTVGIVSKVKLSSDGLRQILSSKHDRYLTVIQRELDPTLRFLATYSAMILELSRNN